jgi:hypothetical protein
MGRSVIASPLLVIIVGAFAMTWLDSNANPIAHGICSLATSNILQRLSCEYGGPAPSPSPAPPPAPVVEGPCPCTHGRYVGGDTLDPRSYVWTWARDGREHSLAERPGGEDDAFAIDQMRVWSGGDPRKRELARRMLAAWGVAYPGRLDEGK